MLTGEHANYSWIIIEKILTLHSIYDYFALLKAFNTNALNCQQYIKDKLSSHQPSHMHNCCVNIMTIHQVDTLIFIGSQDYRYRTINKSINCYHTDESHTDVVAKIILVVESEKRVISTHSS